VEYQYTSTEERVYVDRALVVSPGDVVDWPDGPPADGHWQPTEETQAELDRLAAEQAAQDAAEQKQGEQKQGEQTPDGGTATTGTKSTPAPRAAAKSTKE